MPEGVPAIDGNPTFVLVTFRYIDANGTKDAFPIRTTLARATNAAVAAAATALGAATNTFVYEVRIASCYSTLPSPSSAVEEPRESANDVIEILEKDLSSGASQYVYIPGPLDSMFLIGTNDIDIVSAEFIAVKDAFDALLPVGYQPVSARFAEHKNIGNKTEL